MKRTLLIVGALAACTAQAEARPEALPEAPRFEIPQALRDTAAALAAQGLESDLAWELVESLSTEVGPRVAGSEAEARARQWAERRLRDLGFANVRIEEFEIDYWQRGELDVAIAGPFPQPLVATALGGSGASPEGGLEAELVFFDRFDELAEADGALEGRIVYVNDRMTRAQTGAGYGPANRKRREAWMHAERLGASGVVIRSVGTSSHRFAHTGIMDLPDDRDAPAIPAIALSNSDADQIERIVRSGETVRLRIRSSAGYRGTRPSGNVIAEVPGTDLSDQVVLIGAHLDAWDEGTGAIDDGAGIAIVTAAAKLIAELPQRPRRTIRVVHFGAEEVGLFGARAYARAYDDAQADHVIATESDFGADRVWRFSSGVSRELDPAMEAVASALAPYGVIPGARDVRGGGPDIRPLVEAWEVPTVRFDQSGEDYFDYHHTPDDTLDKIDPEALAQNVAVWAAGIWLLANLDVEYRLGVGGQQE